MRTKNSPFLLLIFISLFFSCKKETTEVTPQQTFEFNINQNGNLLTHQWTPLNVSNFESYIIVRAYESIPLNFTDATSINGFSIVNEIEEISILTSTEVLANQNNQSTFYYRVFAKLTDRHIPSNEINISSPEIPLLEFPTIGIYHHPELKLLYLESYDSLFAYDYTQKQIIGAVEKSFPWNLSGFDYGTHNGEEEIYLITDSDKDIAILNALTLESKPSIESNSFGIDDIKSDKNGLLYIRRSGLIQIIDRSNGEILGQGECNNCYNHNVIRHFELLSDTEKRVGFFSNASLTVGAMDILEFSKTYELISESPSAHIEGGVSSTIVSSPDRKYFVVNPYGFICDSDANIINTLDDNNNNTVFYLDFAFPKDGNSLYTLKRNGNNNSDRIIIEVYSFPELELQNEWFLNLDINDIRLFADDEQLVLVSIKNLSNFQKLKITTIPF